MPIVRLSLCCLLATSLLLAAEKRVWTDSEGRTLEAEWVSTEEGGIKVRRISDRRLFTIPLERLSPVDQAYVRDKLAAEAGEAPPPGGEFSPFPEDGLEWPRRVTAPEFEVTVIREDTATNEYIYETDNFRFRSDIKLQRKAVHRFAEVFESTLAAVNALPLNWHIEIPDAHFQARLFARYSDYLEAGGFEGAAGIYDVSSRLIMMPVDSLGTQKSSTGITLGDADAGTQIHEITHQVHHDWLVRLPTWLVEGFAVYMEAIPYDDGTFYIEDIDAEEYTRKHWGQQKEIPLIPVEEIMTVTAQEWQEHFTWSPLRVRQYYFSAYLLTYYFIHLDGEGDTRRFWLYLRALEDAQERPDLAEAEAILMDGRSYETLQEALINAYKREDIDLVPQPSPF